jgi:hypothetical protein
MAFPDMSGSDRPSDAGEISQFLHEGLPRMRRVFDRVEPSGGSRVAPPSVLPSA